MPTIYVLKERRQMPEDRAPTSGQAIWEDVCATSAFSIALEWNKRPDRGYVILELDPDNGIDVS